MKKALALAICIILILTCFTGCGQKSKGSEKPGADAAFLFGDWDGESWINEVWTFNEDGSGQNQNSIFSYKFNYSYNDGVLNVYEYFGSLKSDSPTIYSLKIVSDNEITLYNEDGESEYTLTR